MADTSVYSLMQTDEPYRSYKKTVPGKLYLTIWDSYLNTPVGLIVEGLPNTESCIVDVYNEREDTFLRRANKQHFDIGYLIPIVRAEKVVEESPNVFTDEELDNLINSRFLSLQSAVNKMTSVAPLFRLIAMAKEQEKSEKIIAFLEGKLSEIQAKEYESVKLQPEEA